MSGEDDTRLVELFLGGDQEAFDRLITKYYGRIFHLVLGILGDWHQGEDVCQEVFTIVYQKLSGFRHRSQFSVWLHRIAVNAALKACKRRKRFREQSLDSIRQEEIPNPERDVTFEMNEEALKLLRPLPEKLRVVVLLRELGGLSYQEIAKVLHCSRGAVEQRIHRAMIRLREVWKDRFAR